MTKFNNNDVVKIVRSNAGNYWVGQKLRVVDAGPYRIFGSNTVVVNADEFGGRPDGVLATDSAVDTTFDLWGAELAELLRGNNFLWPVDDLELVVERADADALLVDLDLSTNTTPEPDGIKVGDTVEIQGGAHGQDFFKWKGLRATVIKEGDPHSMTYLEPHSTRPDGYGTSTFFWDTDDLKKVEFPAVEPDTDDDVAFMALPQWELDLLDEVTPLPGVVPPSNDTVVVTDRLAALVDELLGDAKALGLTDTQEEYVRSRFADLGVDTTPDEPVAEVEEDPEIEYEITVRGRQSEVLALREEAERQVLDAQRFGRFTSVQVVDEFNYGPVDGGATVDELIDELGYEWDL